MVFRHQSKSQKVTTYVNPETGETYKNLSEKHRWTKTNSNTFECEKCDCKKIVIQDGKNSEITYILGNTEFNLEPRCNNSKLINHDKQEEAQQLQFDW